MRGEPLKASRVSITVVVDNVIDIFLQDQHPIRYPRPGRCSSLLAEQGLSIWIEIEGPGRSGSCRILYDFGRGGPALRRNLEILEIDPRRADYLILSHGHIDHYGGLTGLLEDKSVCAPLVVHPRAFGSRAIRQPDGSMAGPWSIFQDEIESLMSQPLLPALSPRQIGSGVWISGFIPRSSTLDPLFSAAVRKEGDDWVADQFEDDLSIFIRLEKAGLVIITGCCHAGVINTLRAASTLFPGEPIFALIGGFHLNFVPSEAVKRIINEIDKHQPGLLVPLHCTGAAAQNLLRQHFKERCPYTTVGMNISVP
ncbi:MAG: MBL fold metallo-hydrolase [Deltaproteobacteria bacterium]|nr:MBL fold metallo-hydrolase [Deltaproteobacteria bacterium]